MPNELLQPSLAGGELSPALYGRVDEARYAISLRQCYNMIVKITGGVENRAGMQLIVESKDSTKKHRKLAFEYSNEIAYVVELGHYYARFIYHGAQLLEVSAIAYVGGTTYALGDFILSGGITYKSLQAANTGHTPATSPTWWFPNPPHEIVTPWAEADLPDVRFTQSADVMYLGHNSYPTKKISRINANKFKIDEFVPKNGPFQRLNGDEAFKVASSAAMGVVTLTASKDLWTADDIGSLFYLEQKDLAGVNPWEPSDRGTHGAPSLGILVGDLRRSDGKTYRASAVTPTPSGTGAFIQTGINKPVHEAGKAWDGPGDARSTGTTNYGVGVQWEYLHSGYGYVLITGFTNARTVAGTVTRRLPDDVVGGIGGGAAPVHIWSFSGSGASTYALAANISPSNTDYTVTIDGVLIQPNPYYSPPTSGSGGGGFTAGGGSGGRGVGLVP